MNWFARSLASVSVKPTRDFAKKHQSVIPETEKEFKPMMLYVLPVLFIVFPALAILMTGGISGTRSLPISLLLPPLAIAVVGGVVMFLILSGKKKNFTITLDAEKMRVGDQIFRWKEVAETAILTKPRGRNRARYLVVVRKGEVGYEKFDLANFFRFSINGFSEELSTYIEYYKAIGNL